MVWNTHSPEYTPPKHPLDFLKMVQFTSSNRLSAPWVYRKPLPYEQLLFSNRISFLTSNNWSKCACVGISYFSICDQSIFRRPLSLHPLIVINQKTNLAQTHFKIVSTFLCAKWTIVISEDKSLTCLHLKSSCFVKVIIKTCFLFLFLLFSLLWRPSEDLPSFLSEIFRSLSVWKENMGLKWADSLSANPFCGVGA